MYNKCLEHINNKNNVYQFQDIDGAVLYSMASDSGMDGILYEALNGLIQTYNSQEKYGLARTYAIVAKGKLPKKNDWEIWLKVLPEIENKTQLCETVKQRLEQSLNENKHQKTSFRLWAQQLIQLQDNIDGVDLDDEDEWAKYEEKMNEILIEMSKTINKDSIVYQQKLAGVNTDFSMLDSDAKGLLVTAEILFEMHKDIWIVSFLFPRATSQSQACLALATAARVKNPTARGGVFDCIVPRQFNISFTWKGILHIHGSLWKTGSYIGS